MRHAVKRVRRIRGPVHAVAFNFPDDPNASVLVDQSGTMLCLTNKHVAAALARAVNAGLPRRRRCHPVRR